MSNQGRNNFSRIFRTTPSEPEFISGKDKDKNENKSRWG